MFTDFEEHELEKISGCFKPKSIKKNDILFNTYRLCQNVFH